MHILINNLLFLELKKSRRGTRGEGDREQGVFAVVEEFQSGSRKNHSFWFSITNNIALALLDIRE